MKDSENDIYSKSKINRKINISQQYFSVFEIVRKIKRGDIDFEAYFQRREKWDENKKSKLIESIIMNIPIQSIYLAEEIIGRFVIIDGQQRLITLKRFLNNEFSLQNLSVLSEYNQNKFTELPEQIRRKIEDFQLVVFIIKKDSNPDIKFDIFERINEGAVALNSQELRNCIYRNKGIPFIRKLASENEYINLLKDKKVDVKGMQDEELVLRFMSFYHKGYKAYNGNVKIFLNDTLENYEIYREREQDFEVIFKDTMKKIYEVFKDDAFIINKKCSYRKMNISLFEIITYSFAHLNYDFIVNNNEKLRKRLENLINSDERFKQSITSSTLTCSNTFYRFEKWLKEIDKIKEEG